MLPGQTIVVRPIESADVPPAERVLAEAYGRPVGHFSIAQRVATAPHDWIVAERDGKLCGIVSATDYGPVAYIGMMAVDPKAQRLGVGRSLIARMIAKLERRGAKTMLLDATQAGSQLYRRFGFAQIDCVGVYCGAPTQSVRPQRGFEGAVERSTLRSSLDEIAGLDRRVFGCDRRCLLERLAQEPEVGCALARDRAEGTCGYVVLRRNVLGPWLATSAAAAGALFDDLTQAHAPLTAFVPQSNVAAVTQVSDRGLVLERSLEHMVRGARSPVRREWLYGQASLGTG